MGLGGHGRGGMGRKSNSISRRQSRSGTVVSGGGGPSFDPVSLFAGGELGSILDFRTADNLRDNSDGTGTIVADGHVGRAIDLSGNDAHWIQATEANQPLWKSTGNIQHDSTDKLVGPTAYYNAAGGSRWTVAVRFTALSASTFTAMVATSHGGYYAGLAQSGSTAAATTQATINGAWTENGTVDTTNRGTIYTGLSGATAFVIDITVTASWGTQKPQTCYGSVGVLDEKWRMDINRALTEDERNDILTYMVAMT